MSILYNGKEISRSGHIVHDNGTATFEECNLDPSPDNFFIAEHPRSSVSWLDQNERDKSIWHNCLQLHEEKNTGEVWFIGKYPVIQFDYVCLKCGRDFSEHKNYIDILCMYNNVTLR